jgi:hypothetical protein
VGFVVVFNAPPPSHYFSCSILDWTAGCWNSLLKSCKIQSKNDVSPAVFQHGSAKKITVCMCPNQTSRRLDSFLHKAAQNFELLSNIQDQK